LNVDLITVKHYFEGIKKKAFNQAALLKPMRNSTGLPPLKQSLPVSSQEKNMNSKKLLLERTKLNKFKYSNSMILQNACLYLLKLCV
jgi:hypothetical protein